MKMLLTLLIIVFWGLWGFFYKIGVSNLGSWKALLLGSIVYGAIDLTVFAYLLSRGIEFNFNHTGAVAIIIGSIFSVAASIVFLVALEKYPASIVVPLTALYPAVTVILGFFILREQIKPENALGIILAIAAGYLLAR